MLIIGNVKKQLLDAVSREIKIAHCMSIDLKLLNKIKKEDYFPRLVSLISYVPTDAAITALKNDISLNRLVEDINKIPKNIIKNHFSSLTVEDRYLAVLNRLVPINYLKYVRLDYVAIVADDESIPDWLIYNNIKYITTVIHKKTAIGIVDDFMYGNLYARVTDQNSFFDYLAITDKVFSTISSSKERIEKFFNILVEKNISNFYLDEFNYKINTSYYLRTGNVIGPIDLNILSDQQISQNLYRYDYWIEKSIRSTKDFDRVFDIARYKGRFLQKAFLAGTIKHAINKVHEIYNLNIVNSSKRSYLEQIPNVPKTLIDSLKE